MTPEQGPQRHDGTGNLGERQLQHGAGVLEEPKAETVTEVKGARVRAVQTRIRQGHDCIRGSESW